MDQEAGRDVAHHHHRQGVDKHDLGDAAQGLAGQARELGQAEVTALDALRALQPKHERDDGQQGRVMQDEPAAD
jgi:hypothetical protein